jgi:hypothetical protein
MAATMGHHLREALQEHCRKMGEYHTTKDWSQDYFGPPGAPIVCKLDKEDNYNKGVKSAHAAKSAHQLAAKLVQTPTKPPHSISHEKLQHHAMKAAARAVQGPRLPSKI